ncbi:MAG: hypothetical protein RR949_00575, partial [Oscillospiraceae bacterium]
TSCTSGGLPVSVNRVSESALEFAFESAPMPSPHKYFLALNVFENELTIRRFHKICKRNFPKGSQKTSVIFAQVA